MAALGVPPPPWTRGAGPVRDDEASAATVFGGGGAGSSAGPPLSTGGTGVEGSAANPGAGGAVVDGGGVHSMGKSGSCSARLVSPAAEWTRKRSEVSVRSGDIGERESDELLERGREGARVMAVEWERRSAGVGMQGDTNTTQGERNACGKRKEAAIFLGLLDSNGSRALVCTFSSDISRDFLHTPCGVGAHRVHQIDFPRTRSTFSLDKQQRILRF